ncbi:hypothetical protein DFR86_05620 [Acidianus sulfidivorans JP7]|uniref:JAB domain-containing protein n=1 Tax=Acidianus sulfidivorans JP7 TaxID=619593 RepID=A0A2U9IM52_9CREN|nr:hypothetical protein DFR86_05620 [Acidianus sulfidivorans JP7]
MGNLKRERCGIIINNEFHEIRNISTNPFEFVMDSKELYQFIKDFQDIQAIVHTHYNNCSPSYLDMENMKIWKTYWIIVSYNCIKIYKYSSRFGVVEVDINSSTFKKFYNLFMQLLH